ncbi:MAG TPA: thioredoxin family protein [Pirellulales bacterium]|jgi:thiol-disulfide isomerase/thioredoxin|nr:thioredoxin family protein [Pirellulales bacterium]
MNAKNLMTTFTILGLSFAIAANAVAEDPKPAPSLVKELVTAVGQMQQIYGLIDKLDQQLSKPGPEADQLAGELLGSLDQIERHPEVNKYIHAIVDQKKERLAAQLFLRVGRAQLAAGDWGRIVIGQLVVEDGKIEPEMVQAQMPILQEGYFADEIKSIDLPICFRARGYRDLDVQLSSYKHSLANVDKVVLRPLPPEERVTLKGTVALDGSSDFKSVQLYVDTAMGPLNTPSGGYSPRASWPKPITVPVSEAGEFTVEGLNPSEVTVFATAPDHVNQYKKIVMLSSDHPTDMGELRLMKSDLGFYVGKAAPEGELNWESDYSSALKRAEAEHKPLMVMMTATWCGPCKMLEKETLNDPWIRSFLSRFVIVKACEDKDVEKKYGGGAYPTLIFADSSGRQMYRCTGYKPAFTFAQDCAKAFDSLSIEQPEAIKTLLEKQIVTLK